MIGGLAALLLLLIASPGTEALAEEPPILSIDGVDHHYGPDPEFKNSVTRLTIKGRSALPDGTELVARLIEPESRWPFQVKGLVNAGGFALELGPYERPLFPGHYEVHVAFFPEDQPPAAREALAGRTSFKTHTMWTFAPDRIAAANQEAIQAAADTLVGLEALTREITGQMIAIRKLDAGGKIPTKGSAEYEALETAMESWTARYDELRVAHDRRLDANLILPTFQLERIAINLINVLMDFQFEHQCRLEQNKDFMIVRELDRPQQLLDEARNALQYTRVRLAEHPDRALREQFAELIAALAAPAAAPLPEPAALATALDTPGAPGAPLDPERRRIALYHSLLAWDALVRQGTKPRDERGADRLPLVNQWLLELNRLRSDPAHPLLADLPGHAHIQARLALAALIAQVEASATAGLDLGPRPAGSALDEVNALLIGHAGLLDVHRLAVRLHWHETGVLAAELGACLPDREDAPPIDWEEFIVPWSSAVLRLLEADLAPLGALAADAPRLARYASDKGTLSEALIELSQLRLASEEALLAPQVDVKTVAALRARIDQLRARCDTHVERLAR